MKLITQAILLSILLTSCATHSPRKTYSKRERNVQPMSRLELRQTKILRCTTEFLRQGVDFEVAVKGCKDDIYYK